MIRLRRSDNPPIRAMLLLQDSLILRVWRSDLAYLNAMNWLPLDDASASRDLNHITHSFFLHSVQQKLDDFAADPTVQNIIHGPL